MSRHSDEKRGGDESLAEAMRSSLLRIDLDKRIAILLTVAATATPIVLSAIRIYWFAQGDPAIIAALTSTMSPQLVVLDAVVRILPSVLLFFGVMAVPWAMREMRKARGDAQFDRALICSYVAVPAALSGIAISQWLAVALYAAIAALLAALYSIARTRDVAKFLARKYYSGSLALVAVVSGATSVVFAATPWLPQENVTIDGSVRSGYVLAASPVGVTIYTKDQRSLLIVRPQQISTREPCANPRSALSKNVIEVLSSGPQIPACLDK